MTVSMIAALALAMVAAALAVIAWRQRNALLRQREEGGPPASTAPAEDAALAMLAALREPAFLYGERIEAVNEPFAALVGLPAAQLAGKALPEIVSGDYAELVILAVQRALAGDAKPTLTEVEIADAHGQVTRLELSGSAIESGGRKRVLFTAEEMLPHRDDEAAGLPPARSQLALDSLGEGILTTDAHGMIDYLNLSAEALTGMRREDALGQAFSAMIGFVDEHDRRAIADPVQQCLATGSRVNLGRRSILISRATGNELGVEATASPIRGAAGDVEGVAVMLHDVSELRGLTQQMSYQASHDALTGLVNRREFERRLGEALEIARGGRQSHVMCFLDLDRFKAVNDTSGHLAGDNMLREVAALIREAVRDSDTVARLGGDEFGILLVGCPLDKARQIADDVWRAIAEYRFVWKDRIFSVGVSIGIVEITGETNSLEEIMNAADSACYVAKKQGDGHIHVYSSHDEAVARSRGEIHWLQRLQAALRDGFFELYVQPIEPTLPGSIVTGPAMEVFVRLHDEGQAIVPAEFFPAAERYRLMSMIDRWVLGSALAAIAAGAIRLPPGRSLSLNISGQTLADPAFLEFVVDELDRTGVQPSQICFEVAESSVIGNLEQARRFVEVLHGMGCRFAL
ncbi:MAG TPA: diguanylate cyclase, partial [Steroidobacteraceae bacterium]|nr:diguanylate cyclase [Steroidobacteraceae bacterium]